MNVSLVVLCLAAFAMIATSVSGAVRVAMPWLDRLATQVTPRHRVRLWLGFSALPALVGILALGVSFLPAMGIGQDHCLAHGPHHPHLCPHHMGHGPGIVLVFIAVVLVVRIAFVMAGLVRDLRLSRDAAGAMVQASDRHCDALVFPSEQPQAFVLGTVRPRVHISRGLLSLGREIVDPVLAHERVHARRHDLLWRAIFPVLTLGHLPPVVAALRVRMVAAQELAADDEAAANVENGRLKLAEALLVLTRLSRSPSPGIAFIQGDLQARVHALLDGHRPRSAWPGHALLLCGLLASVVIGVAHDSVHHGLETLLGALS